MTSRIYLELNLQMRSPKDWVAPYLYITNHGLDRVHDLLLNACLHDLIYDTQCSESRSKWLFFMFANSPHYLEFRDEILAALFMESDRYAKTEESIATYYRQFGRSSTEA